MKEIKYMFVPYKRVKYEDIKEMMKEIFDNIDDEFITLDIYNESKNVEYFIKHNSKRNLSYLTIKSDAKPAKASHILSQVDSLVRKGNHKAGYRITVLYDSVSKYYCDKAYPLFNEFERKFRELIFNVVIMEYGDSWYKDTISEDMEIKLKRMKISEFELAENAFYELDLGDLTTYLFEKRRLRDLKELLELDLDNMNKEDIISSIRECNYITLWEHLFLEVDSSENMEEKLKEIRKYRNIIAHSKFFYNSDYEKSRKLIKGITKEVEQALSMIESNSISEVYNIGLLEGCGVIKATIKSIVETMLGVQETLNNTRVFFEGIEEIGKGFKSIVYGDNE